MILHGKSIKLQGTSIKGEKSITLNMSADTIKTVGVFDRSDGAKPTLRSWSFTAQFAFTWQIFYTFFLILYRGTGRRAWEIVGELSNDTFFTNRWRLTGYGYITRLAFSTQGRGLVTLNLSVTGDGKPEWQTGQIDRSFILGTSTIGNDHYLI